DLARRLPAADAPVLERGLVDHHEHLGGVDAEPGEAAHDALVDGLLGREGAPWEERQLDEREVLAAIGRGHEALGRVLEVPHVAVRLGDLERVAQGLVDDGHEGAHLSLGAGAADLDPGERHAGTLAKGAVGATGISDDDGAARSPGAREAGSAPGSGRGSVLAWSTGGSSSAESSCRSRAQAAGSPISTGARTAAPRSRDR